jgi:hypothetical protein
MILLFAQATAPAPSLETITNMLGFDPSWPALTLFTILVLIMGVPRALETMREHAAQREAVDLAASYREAARATAVEAARVWLTTVGTTDDKINEIRKFVARHGSDKIRDGIADYGAIGLVMQDAGHDGKPGDVHRSAVAFGSTLHNTGLVTLPRLNPDLFVVKPGDAADFGDAADAADDTSPEDAP